MFRWAIIFAVVALVAALLGFGGIAGLSADFAKILLVIGVVLFIVAFVSAVTIRGPVTYSPYSALLEIE